MSRAATSAAHYSSAPESTSLKRSRPSAVMASNFPPLPSIDGEMLLEVLTHRSLKYDGAPSNDEFGDNERLATVGKRVLAMVVALIFFHKKPMLTAADLEVEIDNMLSDSTIDNWVAMYQLRFKIRCTPDARETLKEPQETQLLFNSYVGAVYLQRGLPAVQNWIGKLVDPESEASSPSSESQSDASNKRARSADHHPPPPPLDPPPPLPAQPSQFQSLPGQQNTPILPLFNQTASQRRLTVDWPATSIGPAHAPSWSAECLVNGIVKGRGAGRSKQIAKEEAAKQAYVAMGWAGHPI